MSQESDDWRLNIIIDDQIAKRLNLLAAAYDSDSDDEFDLDVRYPDGREDMRKMWVSRWANMSPEQKHAAFQHTLSYGSGVCF